MDENIKYWVERQIDDSWVYILEGFGGGKHANALAEELPPGAHLVVLERDPEKIPEKLKENIVLISSTLPDAEYYVKLAVLRDKPTRKVKLCEQIHFYDEQWWSEAILTLHNYIDTQAINITTQFANSGVTGDNTMANLLEYVCCPGINHLKDAFKDKPALCVAAGPSLDKNIHLLTNPIFRDGYRLICCIPMLKPLLRMGVTPDYICALDYHEKSAKYLLDLPETPDSYQFIFDVKVNHAVVAAARATGKIVSFFGNGWLDEVLGIPYTPGYSHRKDKLDSGTTVAHLCIHLANYFGCNPILLMGYDMGFSDDKYYPDLIFDAHPFKEEYRDKTLWGVSCSGNDIHGKKIEGNHQFVSYLNGLDYLIAHLKDVDVYDCTEGGMAKKNAKAHLPLLEALHEHCKESIPPIIYNNCNWNVQDCALAWYSLWLFSQEISNVRSFNHNFIGIFETMGDSFSDKEYKDTMRRKSQLFDTLIRFFPRAKGVIEMYSGKAMESVIRSEEELARKISADPEELYKLKIERNLVYMQEMEAAADLMARRVRQCRRRVRQEIWDQIQKLPALLAPDGILPVNDPGDVPDDWALLGEMPASESPVTPAVLAE